jgi:Resolvase, N terminal domain
VIANLDRLARNLHFISGLIEAKIDFVAADMPSANKMTVQIMAVFAEEEARAISARTKAALASAQARSVQLGKHGATLGAKKPRSRFGRCRQPSPDYREADKQGHPNTPRHSRGIEQAGREDSPGEAMAQNEHHSLAFTDGGGGLITPCGFVANSYNHFVPTLTKRRITPKAKRPAPRRPHKATKPDLSNAVCRANDSGFNPDA